MDSQPLDSSKNHGSLKASHITRVEIPTHQTQLARPGVRSRARISRPFQNPTSHIGRLAALHRSLMRERRLLQSDEVAGIMPSPARPSSESGKPTNLRWVFGAGEAGKKGVNMDEKRRTREAEKAEKLMHLICWGPN